ncbi:hypothetical protein DXN05_06640 [Deminuibacter soli]|uniref:Uncharacterized protein n=1 Tax=Deminuibacter soli TaxID=2291815 RepID=A0A3E1NKK6_9BACT|nr:hypothetical protein DXN05_06640 [Deminuibacter soli]
MCLLLFFTGLFARAQNAAAIFDTLQAINQRIAALPCSTGKAQLVSNRAMNLYLTDKVGTYLSDNIDLSYHINTLVFNSSEGTVAVTHNLYSPKGKDDAVHSMMSIGIKTNIFNAWNAAFANKQYNNELGFTLKYNWIGSSKTYATPCNGSKPNARQLMDAQRASLLHLLGDRMNNDATAFEQSLRKIQTAEIPGQDTAVANQYLRTTYYANLENDYALNFAASQAQALIDVHPYNLITSNWTSIYACIPLLTKTFTVTPGFTGDFTNRHPWPWQVVLSHTRLWESSAAGRFLATFRASAFYNNAASAKMLLQTNLAGYRDNGGTDTAYFGAHPTHDVYVGDYKNFVTPALSAQLVYIPPEWHFGLTCMLEQHLGTDHVLNGKLAVPMVLINRKGAPTATLEFQVRFYDMAKVVQQNTSFGDRTSVGVTIGVPFERVAF